MGGATISWTGSMAGSWTGDNLGRGHLVALGWAAIWGAATSWTASVAISLHLHHQQQASTSTMRPTASFLSQ